MSLYQGIWLGSFFLLSLLFIGSSDIKPVHPGTVYVVLAVDTEPGRINPWKYSQSFDFACFDPSSANPRIPQVMDTLWRRKYRDAEGRCPRFTWFIMSHEALSHADNGDETFVCDSLMKFRSSIELFGDEIGWHFHNCGWTDLYGDNRWAWNQLENFDLAGRTRAEHQLNRLLIRRNFLPTAFRSGWVWENNDFSLWLEDIIPFDFSSYPPNKSNNNAHEPLRNIYDWSKAPRKYSAYHPSHTNYQMIGHMRRWVFRTLAPDDIRECRKIFKIAARGEDQVLCYTGHSYDNLKTDLDSLLPGLLRLSESLAVRLVFATATSAAARATQCSDPSPPHISIHENGDSLIIGSDQPLFQRIPYCVLIDSTGNDRRVLPRSIDPRHWVINVTGLSDFQLICAGCTPCGKTSTCRFHDGNSKPKSLLHN